MTKQTISSLCLLAALSLAAAPATQPTNLAGESHQIQNAAQADLLRPRDASSKDGTAIVLYPAQDWRCMTWKFEPAGDDLRLVNYFTNKTFYPDAAADGSAVTQHPAAKEATAAERWRFVSIGDGLFRIEHVATGKALAIDKEGKVIIEAPKPVDSQKWKLLAKPAKFTG